MSVRGLAEDRFNVIAAALTLAQMLNDGVSRNVVETAYQDLIKKGHAIVDRDRWVDCATRAPEKKQLVDFVVGTGSVCCGHLDADERWIDLEGGNVLPFTAVSAWRERPSAPSDEEKETEEVRQ